MDLSSLLICSVDVQASDGSMKEAAELKNRLAEAESALRRNIAECGEAQQEAAQQKVYLLL